MAHVTECGRHGRCVVIESDGWPDAPGSWRSHFDDDVDPAARLNPDGPATFEDRRRGRSGNVTPRAATQAEKDRLAGKRPAPQ